MAASAPQRSLLVVGTGVTAAHLWKRLRGLSANLAVTLVDKARGPGGRFASSRSRNLSGPSGPARLDLGAQYITSESESVSVLAKEGHLKNFTASLHGQHASQKQRQNWVAPGGIASVVTELLHGASPLYQHHLTHLDIVEDANGHRRWQASFKDQQALPAVDAVVLTLPAPQLLQLEGDVQPLLSKAAPGLSEVAYSSRFAVGLWFTPDQASVVQECIVGAGMYVPADQSDIVRFVSNDTVKRGVDCEAEGGMSIVVHSTVQYGHAHREEAKDDGCTAVLQELRRLMPTLPEPVEVKPHKWKFSQVTKAYADEHGHTPNAVLVSEHPLLVLAGDSFASSNYDGCEASASAAARLLAPADLKSPEAEE